jgi:hypothetical protein
VGRGFCCDLWVEGGGKKLIVWVKISSDQESFNMNRKMKRIKGRELK